MKKCAQHQGRRTVGSAVIERVEPLIQNVRGEKAILDVDLARIYGVETRVLNQAVRRNREKFPSDFLMRLTSAEVRQMNRSQVVIGSQKTEKSGGILHCLNHSGKW